MNQRQLGLLDIQLSGSCLELLARLFPWDLSIFILKPQSEEKRIAASPFQSLGFVLLRRFIIKIIKKSS
jgi:hypothetical protein